MTLRSALTSLGTDPKRRAFGWAAAGLCCLCTLPVNADEPRRPGEPNVLREPGELTQVVDAFDGDDLFDLHLSLGYESSWKRANILRETAVAQPGLSTGGFLADNLNVARFKENTSRLNVRADIGLYHDIALFVRLPIILSNEQELTSLEGSANQQSLVLQGAPGEQLFSLPFKSPKRSGIEYLAVGVDAALMSQARDRTKPTWIFGLEGRFDVSEPKHACNANPSRLNSFDPATDSAPTLKCANSSDVNRNGVSGERSPNPPLDGAVVEGVFGSGDRAAGVSRGVTGLELHTYLSRRIKYIEPYGGFRALFEFQNSSSDFGQTDLKGSLVNHPPLRGTVLFGVNVIPWEIRDQFQRVTLDFRFSGTYISEGRDYSELFDALGSSDAPSLRMPNYSDYMRNPAFDANGMSAQSVADPNSRKVYFTGLTDVQAHGDYKLSASFTFQAGEYVKFNLGAAYGLTQGHLISFDQACNPDFDGDLDTAGPCHTLDGGSGQTASGIPNPNYRKTINDPGHRFRVDDTSLVDAWINASVMF